MHNNYVLLSHVDIHLPVCPVFSTADSVMLLLLQVDPLRKEGFLLVFLIPFQGYETKLAKLEHTSKLRFIGFVSFFSRKI